MAGSTPSGRIVSAAPVRRMHPLVQRVVATMRQHLGMDVAFLVQVEQGIQVVRAVDGDTDSFRVAVDTTHNTNETYCGLLLEGMIPELVTDTSEVDTLRNFEATGRVGIGAYVGVPVRFADGTVFGVLACVSHDVAPWLTQADRVLMHAAADILAGELADEREQWRRHCLDLLESRRLSTSGPLNIVTQPIVCLHTGRAFGAEALARFPDADTTTDMVFRRAWTTGYGVDLELRAIDEALRALEVLPADAALTLNVSPRLPAEERFGRLLTGFDLRRVVLELTEHSRMEDVEALSRVLAPLRREGLRLAVDDAGAGYSGLNRILELAPDYIKLDAAITRDVDIDPRRVALVSSLVAFGDRIGAEIVAEGIETQAQHETMRRAGVQLGQGWFLGKPQPLEPGR